MFPGVTVTLQQGAHIGHGAIVHGASVGRNSLIGMNAVLMDEAEIGEECIVGALTFVPAAMKIPRRSLVVGNPARIVKDVTDDMIRWKTQGTSLYQALPAECFQTLQACQPLSELPADRPSQEKLYTIWNDIKSKG
jgi:carbonic anhydrase/acetyltransferase-like protein (isoleucine patch superfamily)